MSDQVSIEKELRQAYLGYSLSVIIGRAIPDARDGLKPVHRRVLYAQKRMANHFNRPYTKSATVVGEVMGKYHPHGDAAIYDAIVRMAQDFSMRDPLEDGQGNFGSIDDDPPAAMRYTEVRMTRLAGEFLEDLDKDTVDFRPNFSNTLKEPSVLPTKVPNLLLNGSSGIAVGMATNIPPHHLGELCDGLLLELEDPDCCLEDLMALIKGPDFPTGGMVYVGAGLREAFRTGRGSVKIRGRVELESRKKGESLVIREIPYGLNKAVLVKKIALLVNDRKVDGVTDLRDESNHTGIRVVLDLRRGVIPEIIINALYKFTALETSFSYNMLAVVNNRPKLLNLKDALRIFLEHRREVIIRRTRFDLKEAEARAHILEGLRRALDHIDEVIALIRASASPREAEDALRKNFNFTEAQAQAILDMRLQKLTGLEHEKLLAEYSEIMKNIAYFKSVLEDERVLRGVIREEVQEVKENYATPRKSEIVREDPVGIELEDIIPDDEVVITLSQRGYIKRTSLDSYHQQKRGGKGIAGLYTGEDDFVQDMITTSNHQFLLVFTNRGRMHQLKAHQVPEGSRTAKGMHIANLLPLEKEETVATILSVRDFAPEKTFFFATRQGMVKRSDTQLYARVRKGGIQALGLHDSDELIAVREVDDHVQVILTTESGLAIRFSCLDVRPMGRVAAGVKGIALRPGDQVVACVTLHEEDTLSTIMTVSSNGYGKRTEAGLYRIQSRGGKGVINFKVSAKTGNVIGAMTVTDTNALLLLTSSNKIIRLSVKEVSNIGRATQGVRLVALDEGGRVVSFDRIDDNGVEDNA